MRRSLALLALAAATLPGLALAAPPPPGPDAPFRSEGEVVYRGSAAYDATRVRGPSVNMAVTRDGKWGGNLLEKDVMLTVTPERISGAGVNLVVSRDAKSLSVEGLVSGIRVRVKATQDTFVGRVGNRQIECTRGADGYWHLSGGVAAIRFKGTADRMPDVPMPQWIFAVIGAI
jgi:hypothetical protein